MNSKTLRPVAPVLASALALMLATGAGYAQDGGKRAEGDQRPVPFAQLDADKDGTVTRAEFDAPRLAALKAMDPNADGVVTLEEMKAEAVARATRRAEMAAERRFKALDLDGDGKISAAEAMMAPGQGHGPQGGDLFGRLDKDRDGVLSASELEDARRLMSRPQKPGERDGHARRHGGGDDGHRHDPRHGHGPKGPHGKGPQGEDGPRAPDAARPASN